MNIDLIIYRQHGTVPTNFCRVRAEFEPDNAPADEAEFLERLHRGITAWGKTSDGRPVVEYAGGQPNFGDLLSHGTDEIAAYIDGCTSFTLEGLDVSEHMTYDTELGEMEE